MKEKKLGRVFKVGDKVKLTKAGEESGFFATEFREGDTAEVMELNKFDGFVSSIKVLTGEAEGDIQYCDGILDIKPWFEHVDDKKTHKKQRKYFRVGDFVTLKDGVNISEVTQFNEIKQGTTGIVVGCADDGMMGVEYFYDRDFDFDYVKPEALRLATKDERKSIRKHKIAKITYDNVFEPEQDTEATEATEKQVKIPPEYDVKVGDIVEVTQYYGGYPVGTIGQVDTIGEDIEGYYNHVVVCGTDGNCWHECNVRLLYQTATSACEAPPNSDKVEDSVTQTSEKETEIPPEYNVKIGDYVKITENADGHPVGTVGFVIEIEEVPEGYYNHVVVSDFDDNCWNEHNVKLFHRASLTCEDEDISVSNSVVTPATDEEKVIMMGDNLVNRHTESIYTVILIDDIFESELPYHITSKNESMWISDGAVVQDYAKLLEDGRVYDWTTDTTFANVESWTNSTK